MKQPPGHCDGARSLDRETDVVIVGQGCDRLIRSEIRRPDSRLIVNRLYAWNGTVQSY